MQPPCGPPTPICRRGYDVVTFAAAGGHAVGLDISPTAKQEAEAYRDATLPPDAAQRAAYVQGGWRERRRPRRHPRRMVVGATRRHPGWWWGKDTAPHGTNSTAAGM